MTCHIRYEGADPLNSDKSHHYSVQRDVSDSFFFQC